jgi:hypothetical protein
MLALYAVCEHLAGVSSPWGPLTVLAGVQTTGLRSTCGAEARAAHALTVTRTQLTVVHRHAAGGVFNQI